ncbi:MAG: GAF and ANTAR domain-containing protein [Janthinobacterium lividum]
MNGRERTRSILSELSGSATGVGELPRLLVQLCSRALPVTGVGLTMMSSQDASLGLAAATDGAAVVLEELQFTLGEGPCVDASRSGRPVLLSDLAHTPSGGEGGPRWPMFTPAALDAGVAAIFAFPLRIGAIRIGVLDLYRDRTGVLAEAEVTEALAFAAAALTVVLHLQSHPPTKGRRHCTIGAVGTAIEQGPWALPLVDDRAVVHQATGMVSVTSAVSLAQALVLIRARAYSDDRPVNDVATDIVVGGLRLGGDPSAGSQPGV